MARQAPSVDRVIAVLNFFAEHPDSGFSLTDIIRSLHFNRATCHSLLKALADSGYLYRDAAKKYHMGPALAAIGRIAHQSFAPVTAARDEMRRLADTYDVVCLAASRVGNELIFLEKTVSKSHLGATATISTRNMIHPPGGSSFVAWASRGEIDAWLGGFDPPLDPVGRSNVLAALERIRELHYSYSIRAERGQLDPLTHMAEGSRLGGAGFVPDFSRDIVAEESYPLAYISAPVLGPVGEVLFTISLVGFRDKVTGARIMEMGTDLRDTTEGVAAVLANNGLTRR